MLVGESLAGDHGRLAEVAAGHRQAVEVGVDDRRPEQRHPHQLGIAEAAADLQRLVEADRGLVQVTGGDEGFDKLDPGVQLTPVAPALDQRVDGPRIRFRGSRGVASRHRGPALAERGASRPGAGDEPEPAADLDQVRGRDHAGHAEDAEGGDVDREGLRAQDQRREAQRRGKHAGAHAHRQQGRPWLAVDPGEGADRAAEPGQDGREGE